MSKQTINIGASPNDGTGTPLRTSFDYCNQNFTELYTATGPSGNNIVVPGNATITGDLTVRTNKLAVTSTGVGCGTTTPALPFVVSNAGAQGFEINPNGTLIAGGVDILSYNRSTSLYKGIGFGAESYLFKVGTASVTDAMTLNSTGLGIGMSPSAILSALKSSATQATGLILRNANGADGGSISLDFETSAGTSGLEATLAGRISGRRVGGGTTGALDFFVNNAGVLGSAKMTIDSSGNVGIGITPSAWGSGYKSVQVNEAGGFAGKNDGLIVAQNCYFNGTNWVNNRASTYSSRYDMNVAGNGIHAWYVYNASFGTVGNTIPFTQAMTLDASGYLLLGTTDTTFTSGAGYKFGPGATPSNGQVGASSSNGDLTLRVYSTGAAAYRFYVGFGGTVFATSATISAISDARLKENVQNLDVGLNEILALKPRKFDWKAGKGKDIKGDRGFIAQEFETVFPNLIDEWADPAPEGEAPYKSVRQDLIPVLVKAIQELTARVQTLETR